MQPCRSEFIDLRQRRLHLWIWGDDEASDAPTIFLLHGWGDLGASFQFVVDALPGKRRVIAPDWRGFGRSQWNDGPYWFADYIADLDALLTQYSPEHPAYLAGHSLGGIVASLYAGIRPERVSRLANLEGFGLWVAAPDESPARFEKWLQQIRDDDAAFRPYACRADYAQRLRADNPRLTAERATFLAEHSLRAVDDGRLEGYVFAADPRHRWINPLLYPLDEAKACWRRVSARTLWIAGAQSTIATRVGRHAVSYRECRDCFADLADVLVDDCGHNLHHDQPERLAHVLSDFFG